MLPPTLLSPPCRSALSVLSSLTWGACAVAFASACRKLCSAGDIPSTTAVMVDFLVSEGSSSGSGILLLPLGIQGPVKQVGQALLPPPPWVPPSLPTISH